MYRTVTRGSSRLTSATYATLKSRAYGLNFLGTKSEGAHYNAPVQSCSTSL